MLTRLLVDAKDIEDWAERLEARSELPRLTRGLLLATTPGIEVLHFPAGEGIQAGGWDGIARASNASAFVPDGTSVWETSTEGAVKGKAKRGYDKRTGHVGHRPPERRAVPPHPPQK